MILIDAEKIGDVHGSAPQENRVLGCRGDRAQRDRGQRRKHSLHGLVRGGGDGVDPLGPAVLADHIDADT